MMKFIFFVIETEYSIQTTVHKNIYKMRKRKKNKKVHENTKRTTLTETTFYNIIKTTEHTTFHITDRALTDHEIKVPA